MVANVNCCVTVPVVDNKPTTPMQTHEVQMILQRHVLPHLSIESFGKLACSSSVFRDTLATTATDLWTSAAGAKLGPQHPAVRGSNSVTDICEALQRQQLAHNSLKSRTACSLARLPGAACSARALLSTSPDSQLVAATSCERQQHHALVLTHLPTASSTGFNTVTGILELAWWADSRHITTLHIDSLQVSAVSSQADGGIQLELLTTHALPVPLPLHSQLQRLAPGGQRLLLMTAETPTSTHVSTLCARTASEDPMLTVPVRMGDVSSSWSQDGKHLALLYPIQDSRFAIVVPQPGGSRQSYQLVLRGSHACLGQWSACKRLTITMLDRDVACLVIADPVSCSPHVKVFLDELFTGALRDIHIAWSPTGEQLAVMGLWDVWIISSGTGALLRCIGCRGRGSRWQSQIQWSGDGCFLAMSSDDAVCVLDAEAGKLVATILEPHVGGAVSNLQWATNGNHLLWSGYWWYRFPTGTADAQPSNVCQVPSNFIFAKLVTFG